MRDGDTQVGTPQVLYKNTKTAIEALTGIAEGAVAYATNNPSAPLGLYNGATWDWYFISLGGAGGMDKAIYDPRNIQNDVFVHVTAIEPASPFKGMLWYDSTGDIARGLIFTTSDNSQYLGVI